MDHAISRDTATSTAGTRPVWPAYAVIAGAVALGLHWIAGYNYPLFHSLVEFARIAVCVGIFTLAWNSTRWRSDGYLTLLGVSYLFVAITSLLHALAYKGISAFPGYETDLPTQLWILTRAIEAVSWCVAPFFVRRPLNAGAVAVVYAVATGIAMSVVFADRFPRCYIDEGVGLTPFKIWSEYAFVVLFALALILLARQSHAFDRAVHRTLMLSLPLSVTAEIAFTRYAGVFDAANEAGHLLLLAAILLVYRAILVTGIVNPFDLLFREARLHEEELELRVRTRTAQFAASEARFQQLFDCSADGIFLLDDENRIIVANQTACTRLGYMKAELAGLPVYRIRADGHAKEDYDNVRRAGEAVFEAVQKTSDGRHIPVEVNARVFDHAGEHAVLSVARDITERVRALAKIRESGELLERMFSAVHVLIAYLDRDLNFVRVNDAYAAADRRTPDYFVGKNHFALYPNPDLEAAFRRVIDSGNPESRLEHPFTYPEHPEFGVTYWDWRLDPVRDASGGVQGAILSLLDITERKKAQEALRALNRSLRMLSLCNATLVHAADEHTLVKEMCRTIAEVGLYDGVWIGLVQGKGDLSVRCVACSQCAAKAMDVCEHLQQDRQLVREVLQSGEQRAGAASDADAPRITVLPLRSNGDALGILALRRARESTTASDEASLLAELTADLAFGIATLRTRNERDRIVAEHAHHEAILRNALEESIAAIAATVERRDLYTAGHESRVADLCVAIGKELRMDEERLHGLRLAASVHDLGKIQVPAEILTKPGRLNPIELSLIKLHPQVGYDILKDIDFPWPIADIILQHHEALDGSGYPHGLKGDDILLEARVLTVADVVEAMSSHRPYRAALGLESALAEIKRNRGTRFDADVVDACVSVFTSRSFSFGDIRS